MNTKEAFPTALEYLDSHEKVVTLMHTAKQLMEIENACNRILPVWFSNCHILKLENGTLLVGVPNQAVAARIRQKIPFLQNRLGLKGWPVHTVRLKVSFLQNLYREKPVGKKNLSPKAYESFSKLYEQFEQNDTYSPLTRALHQLISGYRQTEK